MTNEELANAIRHRMFAQRDTLKEAWDYAFSILNNLPPSERLTATTGMMVLLNTISNEILKNERGYI